METEFLFALALAAGGYFLYKKHQENQALEARDEKGRLEDSAVTTEAVLDLLKKFKPVAKDMSYTEKQVQAQLKAFLNKKIVSVVTEKGLEGLDANKIDFDLGHGSVGLEVKLAKSVFKASQHHRMTGQIADYLRTYDDDNLILLVIVDEDNRDERAYKKRLEDSITGFSKGVEIKFTEISIEEFYEAPTASRTATKPKKADETAGRAAKGAR